MITTSALKGERETKVSFPEIIKRTSKFSDISVVSSSNKEMEAQSLLCLVLKVKLPDASR